MMDQSSPGQYHRRKKKKPKITTVKNRCDRLWSQVVRAGGYCEKCGKTADEAQLHPHHVYGRGDHRLRWEPRNGCRLCAHCHRWWAHAYPLEFALWFSIQRPEDTKFLQSERKKGLIKRTLHDYLELEAYLKSLL